LAIETIAIHHEMDDGDSTPPAEHNGAASVAVVDEHDAIHAAVELWCSKAQPPIRFAGNYFSAEQFLAEHPSPFASGVGPIVLELQKQGECGPSTPRWDGLPPPRPHWWPGPFRTASSTSTTSS
jgi:hypothetical protein